MVRIPSSTAVVLEQTVAFPEPDHAPEFAAQVAYEELRDGGVDVWAGVEEPREVVDRQGSVQHSSRCVVPSHQEWSVEMFGKPRDYDSGKGCVHG